MEVDMGQSQLPLTSNFTSDKIQDGGGRHFENRFNGYISAAMASICTKFCTGLKAMLRREFCRQNLLPTQFKMAASHHFENT